MTQFTQSTRLYLSYDDAQVPQHPGPDWTRFVCMSDTHSRTLPNIPAGDVLLHAGDLSSWGYPEQLNVTLSWLTALEHPIKILIAGNHDLCLDKSMASSGYLGEDESRLESMRSFMKSNTLHDANMYYIENESISFVTKAGKRWTVYGCPTSEEYTYKGAFQYTGEDEAKAIFQCIPAETEILLTHGPPHMILDLTKRGKNAGSLELAERLQVLDSCRLHVFGHIHEARGAEIITLRHSERVSVNAAIANRRAQAVIVDLKNQVE